MAQASAVCSTPAPSSLSGSSSRALFIIYLPLDLYFFKNDYFNSTKKYILYLLLQKIFG
jgi:hypothetical protein